MVVVMEFNMCGHSKEQYTVQYITVVNSNDVCTMIKNAPLSTDVFVKW